MNVFKMGPSTYQVATLAIAAVWTAPDLTLLEHPTEVVLRQVRKIQREERRVKAWEQANMHHLDQGEDDGVWSENKGIWPMPS